MAKMASLRHHPQSAPLGLSTRRHAARPRTAQRLTTCSIRDPWATLGVPQTASEDEVKQAHRKLVKQHHPDVRREDPAAHARFISIQAAYELITGKRQGKDIDRPTDKSGWHFHDWYWSFSLKRRRAKGAPVAGEEAPATPREQWQAQMAGLKQKAAAKHTRWQQQRRRGASDAAASACPSSSAAARESVWRSTTRNARNTDKAAAQQAAMAASAAAAVQSLGEEQHAAQPAEAADSQPLQHTYPCSTAATHPAAGGLSGTPLRHVATADASPASHQHSEPVQRSAAQEENGADVKHSSFHSNSSSSSSHIERLRQMLEHAVAMVLPVQPDGGAERGEHAAQEQHVPPVHAASTPAAKHQNLRSHVLPEHMVALLNGQQANAVPADKHLHRRFKASMRVHRIEQQAKCEGRQEQEQQQPQHHHSAAHSRKFANRDEVESRLSSQMAGLKRRAKLKQEVDASC